MQDTSTFDVTNHLHVECLRYCFMEVIQTELDRIVQHWNLHEIRSQRHSDIPSGKHGLFYYVPTGIYMKFDRRGIRTSLLVSMGCFTTCQRYSEDAIMLTMLI